MQALANREAFQLNTEGSVVAFVENILQMALQHEASDIHLEPYEKYSCLRYRIDGVLLEVPTGNFLRDMLPAVIARIKILSALDIAERRLPQDGGFRFECRHGTTDVRVSTVPTLFGERVAMRMLKEQKQTFDYAALGLPPSDSHFLQTAISKRQGMIVVCGPTGSGKTTTLYTVLEQLNDGTLSILTVEDPVERRMSGLSQVQVHEAIGLGFAQVLRAFLRQDPEVILVGEIRDYETADVAVKAALTGHLVLSSLHTQDAATAITRLVNIGIPLYLVSAAISLVLAQRLLRTICPHCKTPQEASEQWSQAPGLKDHQLFVGTGCKHCSYTGCRGRTGVFEVLDPGKARSVNRSGNADQIQLIDASSDPGYEPLQHHAKKLVAAGTVSLAEYWRVFGKES